VRAIARKTAKTTAKRMVYNYIGKRAQQCLVMSWSPCMTDVVFTHMQPTSLLYSAATQQPGIEPKKQGKLLVQQQAQSMKARGAQPSSGSQHQMMLQSHNSRSSLGARPDGAKPPQSQP
jgi:hypothetical protein